MKTRDPLSELRKANSRWTLLVLGGGILGMDVRKTIVSRGVIETSEGPRLAYSEPRGRKKYRLDTLLRHGVIVLAGHETSMPVFETHKPARGGLQTFVMDGQGGRFFVDDGPEKLLSYLKTHAVMHTLKESRPMVLVDQDGNVTDNRFGVKLLEALKDVKVDYSGEDGPPTPQRKELLTPAMKEALAARFGKETSPLYKLFLPEGSATWLLFSIEPDGDTLWVVADLGMGCVEYGTVSLIKLETARGSRFGLPVERDKFFDGKGLTVADLVRQKSLT